MGYPKFIVSNQKEESISIQRVKQLWQGAKFVCNYFELDQQLRSCGIAKPYKDSIAYRCYNEIW